ncbi:hypothetical protein BDFG_02134 [Blastomyces dermatitidis ATCC 26199]|nr:hypothetical protein BDFG_02134 [Blastomyces dermatitidis ATCC 26199]
MCIVSVPRLPTSDKSKAIRLPNERRIFALLRQSFRHWNHGHWNHGFSRAAKFPQGSQNMSNGLQKSHDEARQRQRDTGERAAPTKSGTNDSKIGSRLDVGALVKKDGKEYRRYYLQLNINAENSTIRKEAQQDSHRTLSFADVEIKQNPTDAETEAAVESLFDDLSNNVEAD